MARWRNWQTRRSQKPVIDNYHVGSTPSRATKLDVLIRRQSYVQDSHNNRIVPLLVLFVLVFEEVRSQISGHNSCHCEESQRRSNPVRTC